jgi:hypothetical protein
MWNHRLSLNSRKSMLQNLLHSHDAYEPNEAKRSNGGPYGSGILFKPIALYGYRRTRVLPGPLAQTHFTPQKAPSEPHLISAWERAYLRWNRP